MECLWLNDVEVVLVIYMDALGRVEWYTGCSTPRKQVIISPVGVVAHH